MSTKPGQDSAVSLVRTSFMLMGILTLVICSALWLGLSSFAIYDQRRDEKAQAVSMARFLQRAALHQGAWEKRENLEPLMHQLSKIHHSLCFSVVVREGRAYAKNFVEPLPELAPKVPDLSKPDPTVVVQRDRQGKVIYDVVIPLTGGNGYARIGYRRGNLSGKTLADLRNIAIASFIALLLGLGISWTIARMISKDVNRAHRALKESEERYRMLFDQAPDSIMLLDLANPKRPMIIDANEATALMHGFTRDEIARMSIADLDAPSTKEHIKERVRRIMDGGLVTFECEHIRKDGSRFPVEVICHKVEIDGKPAVQAIDRDISERRKAEEDKRALEAQLHQAQKMEAVGRLAGGIAHDINNILGVILGAASLLEEKSGDHDPENEETVANILIACRRGRDLTRNILGFTRKSRYLEERLSINELIEELQALFERTISKKIIFTTGLEPDIADTSGDKSLISQALMNICINAVDALKDEGSIIVTTHNREFSQRYVTNSGTLEPGSYVEIRVSDTGTGMDQETLAQAMDPFYTTKPVGKGTGLGLSMVYGTMRSHGGGVSIVSAPDMGTTVSLIFPVTDVQTIKREDAAKTSVTVPAACQPACILLVEDEKLLRWSGQRILKRLGHTVLLAEDGRRAVATYEQHRDQISLVVLDLIMPDMDGSEAFHKLKELNPDLNILLTSGYSRDKNVDTMLAEGASGFVEKPFDKETLGAAVTAALNRT